MRRCVICGVEKEDEFFIHDKYAKGGIRNVCLECNKKRAKMRRAINQKHYEELENRINLERQLYKMVLEENTKLKNLLKEIRGKLKYVNTPRNNHNIFANDLMKRIDQVLQENNNA